MDEKVVKRNQENWIDEGGVEGTGYDKEIARAHKKKYE